MNNIVQVFLLSSFSNANNMYDIIEGHILYEYDSYVLVLINHNNLLRDALNAQIT